MRNPHDGAQYSIIIYSCKDLCEGSQIRGLPYHDTLTVFCFDKKNNNNAWSHCDGLFTCRPADWLCNGEIAILSEKDATDYCSASAEPATAWSSSISYYKSPGLEKPLF